MREITVRTKDGGTTATTRVSKGEKFGMVILGAGFRARMGMSYTIEANTDGGQNLVTVKSDDVIPETVTIVELESGPKC